MGKGKGKEGGLEHKFVDAGKGTRERSRVGRCVTGVYTALPSNVSRTKTSHGQTFASSGGEGGDIHVKGVDAQGVFERLF